MKTQVIQLDAFDDIVSAKDKLLWSKSPRIIIVFPEKSEYRFNYVDLSLLNRQALRQGVQLALVATKADLIELGKALDISVFRSVVDANNKRWKRSRRKSIPQRENQRSAIDLSEQIIQDQKRISKQREMKPLFRIPIFSMGFLAFISIFFLFIPKATVIIHEEEIPQSILFEIYGTIQETSENSVVLGKIPIYSSKTHIKLDGKLESTGFVTLPKTRATGVAIITNLGSQMIEIPEGIIFSTLGSNPIRYKTMESAILPAVQSQSIEVPMEALEPGIEGNISVNELLAVEGELGSMISVQNTAQFSGGAMEEVPAPTQRNYDTLRDELYQLMNQAATDAFIEKKEMGKIYLPSTVALVDELDEQIFPSIGMPGDYLQLTIENEYSSWYILEADIVQAANLILDANLLDGFVPGTEVIEVEYIGDPIIDDGTLIWQIKANRMISSVINEEELISLITGRNIELARELLITKLSLNSIPEINLFPVWWQYLPIFSFQIQMEEN